MPLRRTLLVVALVAAALGGTATPAEAAAPVRLPEAALGALDPSLAGLPVTGEAIGAAVDRFDGATDGLAAAGRSRRGADAGLLGRTAEADRAEAERVDRANGHARATAALRAARADLVDIAVTAFLDGPGQTGSVLDPGSPHEEARRELLGDVSEARGVDVFTRAEALEARTAAAEGAATELARAAEVARQQAVSEAATAVDREAAWAGELVRARAGLVAAAPSAMVAQAGVPVVTLDAYVRAAATVDGCGIGWPLLAGIGRIESGHGTFRGARVAEDGAVRPRIIGISLDGTRGTMAIADSDGGALDGDTVADRAVGPMQFIPGTWRSSGADGNGDGVADPHNLYDAAAAAAGYLCLASGGVAGSADLGRAVFSYNHSDAYVASVLAQAATYGRLRW